MRPEDNSCTAWTEETPEVSSIAQCHPQRINHNSTPNVSIVAYAPEQRPLHLDAPYRLYVMNTKLSMGEGEGCCVDDGQCEVRIDDIWSVFAFARKLSTR